MPVYEEKLICPLSIRFSQNHVRTTFRDGSLVDDTVALVKACTGTGPYELILQAPFPSIEIVRHRPGQHHHPDIADDDEHWFAIDNRRLYVLQRAAVNLWPRKVGVVVEALYHDAGELKRKYDSTSCGKSVMVSASSRAVTGAVWSWLSEVCSMTLPFEGDVQMALDMIAQEDMLQTVTELTDPHSASGSPSEPPDNQSMALQLLLQHKVAGMFATAAKETTTTEILTEHPADKSSQLPDEERLAQLTEPTTPTQDSLLQKLVQILRDADVASTPLQEATKSCDDTAVKLVGRGRWQVKEEHPQDRAIVECIRGGRPSTRITNAKKAKQAPNAMQHVTQQHQASETCVEESWWQDGYEERARDSNEWQDWDAWQDGEWDQIEGSAELEHAVSLLAGLWEGPKGEKYQIQFEPSYSEGYHKPCGTCVRQDSKSLTTFSISYDQDYDLLWWGTHKKFVLDCSELANSPSKARWYREAEFLSTHRGKPVWEWMQLPGQSVSLPVGRKGRAKGWGRSR